MSIVQLRDYQIQGVADINAAWRQYRNVLYVLPCRAGKTVVVAAIIESNQGITVAMAHRSELVGQMSRTLARNGIHHRILGSDTVRSDCVRSHLLEFGRNYVNQNSHVIVASVATLVRVPLETPWLNQVTLWICDETAHLTAKNQWGKAVAMFPNARGLGVTATPVRADGLGLGHHADGVMNTMIIGPSMLELGKRGFLAPYRIFAPKSDLDLSLVATSAGGDYSPKPLSTAVHKSHITGDAVEHYLKIAPGKLALVFCVDVKAAREQAAAFRAAGVSAEMIDGTTPMTTRISLQKKHQVGEILVLCNVDLYGEGVDIPNLDVVIMARPTQSYGLYHQQFNRCLNPIPGKIGIIIDHVGNVLRHGLPDAPRAWTLDRREKRARANVELLVKVRTCPSCAAVYERELGPQCPFCGEVQEPVARSGPELVDGDLHELSPEVLARMRGEIEAVNNAPAVPYGATPEILGAIKKRHRERLEALAQLREAMALWAAGMDDIPRAQRRFYITFGVDVATAQTLNKRDALELLERIKNDGN